MASSRSNVRTAGTNVVSSSSAGPGLGTGGACTRLSSVAVALNFLDTLAAAFFTSALSALRFRDELLASTALFMAASPAFIGVTFCVPLPLEVATERVEDLVVGILSDGARNERGLNRIL